MTEQLIQLGMKAGLALALALAGYVAAKYIASLVYRALKRTELDNKLGDMVGLKSAEGDRIERAAQKITFYLIMAMVLVAVLDFAGLSQAAGPISLLLTSLLAAVIPIAKATAIVGIAWLIARGLRSLATRGLAKTALDQKLSEWSATERSTDGKSGFSAGVGTFLYWLVLFFGITAGMEALGISSMVAPLTGLAGKAMGMLPALFVAGIIAAVGWFGGKFIGKVVTNLLASAGLDEAMAKIKLDQLFAKRPASAVGGMIIAAFVMLQAGIAALDKLGIEALSGPLTAMMATFWAVIPAAAVAAIIVAVGIVVARIVRDVLSNVLESIGFDGLLGKLGLADLETKSEKLKTPSLLVGRIAYVAVVLVAAVQALNTLGLGSFGAYIETLLAYAVQNVLPAIIIVGLAFGLGGFVRELIASTDDDEERQWLASMARYAILVFAFTMALHQLDVAQTFVTTAFALAFGAVCLAGALAFGLGGRDVAGKIVAQRYDKATRGPRSPGADGPLSGAMHAADKRDD